MFIAVGKWIGPHKEQKIDPPSNHRNRQWAPFQTHAATAGVTSVSLGSKNLDRYDIFLIRTEITSMA
jgi:hypothetical protein